MTDLCPPSPTKSDSIRPLDIGCHQNLSVHSIHTRLLNLCRFTPVRPVQKPTRQTFTQGLMKVCHHLEINIIPDLINTQTFHLPRQWIHSNGGWFFEASVEQNFLFGSVEGGHRNSFGAEVRPVQVFIDPVHSNTHRGLDIVDYPFMAASVLSFVQLSALGTKKNFKCRFNVNSKKKKKKDKNVYLP